MKKNLLNFSVKTIAVMAILVIFTMCKRETECQKCGPSREPDAIEKVTFNIANETLQAEFAIMKNVIDGNNRESSYVNSPNDNLFLFIKNYCLSKNITVNNQTMFFVIYYDFLITQSLIVIDENIKGISVYNVEGKTIMHHLFVKNEQSEFYEVENVRVAVPAIAGGYINFYLKNYVFTDCQNKTDIWIGGNFARDVWKNKRKYESTPVRFEIRNSKAQVGAYNYTCQNDFNCPAGAGACKFDMLAWKHYCQNSTPICSATAVDNTLTVAQKIERTFINIDLMHSFRDIFLYNSTKGETYVDNYYYLSSEYEGKIGLPLAVQTALFFRKFNPVMEACVNPGGRQSEIMFDNTLTQSLLELLDEYEAITTSREGKAILASVKADVNRFNGKTLQELLAVFQ
ncbi:MAG: hypothetical protein FWC10_07210 [Lentimicrobiaceae bacterium]|nr:hypothetical protein [Lentimicrobiaceae bacterium]